MTALDKTISGMRTIAADIAEGFFEITHNSFALLGLFMVVAVAVLGARRAGHLQALDGGPELPGVEADAFDRDGAAELFAATALDLPAGQRGNTEPRDTQEHKKSGDQPGDGTEPRPAV